MNKSTSKTIGPAQQSSSNKLLMVSLVGNPPQIAANQNTLDAAIHASKYQIQIMMQAAANAKAFYGIC